MRFLHSVLIKHLMMMNEITEKSMHEEFVYTRYKADSKILEKEITYGVIFPKTNLDSGIKPLETIYFLHGGDGNDQQFISSNFLGSISKEIKSTLISKRIQIVLPDIGLSYLKDRYESFFLKELLPLVEENISPPPVRRLYGISMGGTAAFNVFLKHPSLFNSIAVHFPGLIEFNPFDDSESNDYKNKTGISDEKMGILRWCFQTPFKDYSEFKENDPQALLKNIDFKSMSGKKLYFDCAKNDDYGLNYGATLFSEKLNELKIEHQMHLREGHHNIEFALSNTNHALKFMI